MTGTGYFTLSFRVVAVLACLSVGGISLTSCQKNNAKSLEADTAINQDIPKAINPKAINTETLVESPPPSDVSISATPITTITSEKMDNQKSSSVAQSTAIPTNKLTSSQEDSRNVSLTALPTTLPSIAPVATPLSRQNFAETFARNALLAEDFHAISLSDKYQQLYIVAIQGMTQKMSTEAEDADNLFVKNMLAHHQVAITLASIQLKYGKDETLQRLAQDILVSQQAEATLLSQWLTRHPTSKRPATTLKALQTEYEQNIQDMSNAMLKGVNASNADKTFVQVLLPHHKGALAMAESELSYGKDKTVRDMAVNIIASQQGEISLMKNWLNTQRKH